MWMMVVRKSKSNYVILQLKGQGPYTLILLTLNTQFKGKIIETAFLKQNHVKIKMHTDSLVPKRTKTYVVSLRNLLAYWTSYKNVTRLSEELTWVSDADRVPSPAMRIQLRYRRSGDGRDAPVARKRVNRRVHASVARAASESRAGVLESRAHVQIRVFSAIVVSVWKPVLLWNHA